MVDDLSHLDFELSDELKDLSDHVFDDAKSAAIITPINNLETMTAFCVINDIHAVVVENGIYESVAFLEDIKLGHPEAAIERFTKSIEGLDAVLATYRLGRIETKLYRAGKFVEDLVPTFVLGNFSDIAEDALIGEINLFELIKGKEVKIDAAEVAKHLPKNYIPKKYQPLKPQEIDYKEFQIKLFDTHVMPKDKADEILAKYRKRGQ